MTLSPRGQKARQAVLNHIPFYLLPRVLKALRDAKKDGTLEKRGWEKVVSEARFSKPPAVKKQRPDFVNETATDLKEK